MSVKISVIMPVYNASEYLGETLDSLVNQTFKEFELIAVNDGSTDESLSILERYASEHPFINIINQSNSGPSAARNAALKIAKGEFVYFCDSDDIVEKNGLELLYYTAEDRGADLVLAKYDFFNQYTVFDNNVIDELLNTTYIYPLDTQILWTFVLFNKLFRREIIEQFDITFPSTNYSEDGVFVMNYVYHARFITGINKIVYHYRKSDTSITSVVSGRKVADYIESHNLIFEYASQYLLRLYPQYSSIEDAMRENRNVYFYLNAFWEKETQTLLGQFYKNFWTIEQDVRNKIVDEINNLLDKMDLYHYSNLQNLHFELPLHALYKYPSDLKNKYKVHLAVFGVESDEDEFVNAIENYHRQNFVPLAIYVPAHMKACMKKNRIDISNIFFIKASTQEELYSAVLEQTEDGYLIFGNLKIHYSNNGIFSLCWSIQKEKMDFVSDLLCVSEDKGCISVSVQEKAYRYFWNNGVLREDGYYDYTIFNKIFSVAFLKECNINFSEGIGAMLKSVFRLAQFQMVASGNSVYTGKEKEFISEMLLSCGVLQYCDDAEMRNYIQEQPITLFSKEIKNKVSDVKEKLIGLPKPKNFKDKIINYILKGLRHLPVRDKVFFMNIRSDTGLEGNAAALEPYIEGKKVIYSKRLPHDSIMYRLKMYYHTFTSKVIICDDYNRYLRIFPLKPEQRVIQLWHACGAFKKFGRYGTNISIRYDLATHVQYNLVCVSASNIRSIYADSFDIPITKVKSLGCPRTDLFYDKEYIQEKVRTIYDQYPELKDKKVIIYAPTFRDVPEGDRSVSVPELDFTRLSEQLCDDQMFVICPHPLMKKRILDKKYENIVEIRDYSTNDMMFASDMLITDYSSVIFEYALLRKPMAFYCYDIESYERGFYLNYPDDLPGRVLYNMEELVDYLGDTDCYMLSSNYDAFIENYMSACDGHSTERIAALINDYIAGADAIRR